MSDPNDKTSEWWNTPGQGAEIKQSIEDLYGGKEPEPPPPTPEQKIWDNS